jgi:hypothetical protein
MTVHQFIFLPNRGMSIVRLLRCFVQARALVKMVRVGAPFQYQQVGGLLTVRKLLWTLNFFGRVLLNKMTFGLTPNPVFIQVSDPNLKYSVALRRADILTASLWLITVGALSKIFGIGSRLQSFLWG